MKVAKKVVKKVVKRKVAKKVAKKVVKRKVAKMVVKRKVAKMIRERNEKRRAIKRSNVRKLEKGMKSIGKDCQNLIEEYAENSEDITNENELDFKLIYKKSVMKLMDLKHLSTTW